MGMTLEISQLESVSTGGAKSQQLRLKKSVKGMQSWLCKDYDVNSFKRGDTNFAFM